MAWIISVETKDETPAILYWNRHKGEWQESLTTACQYPTRIGSQRIWKQFADRAWPYINGRPVRSIAYKHKESE
jgi:hypothetical protein